MTTTEQTTTTELHDQIIDIVADCCLVKPEQIKASERGNREIGDARKIVCWMLYHKLNFTLYRIGSLLGGRDHSTIINSLKVVDDLYPSNKEFSRKFECSMNVVKNLMEDGSGEV